MNILTSVDLSDATPRILQVTGYIATALSAEVWLLHVAEPDPEFMGYEAGPEVVREQVAREMRDEHRDIQACAEKLRDDGVEATALQVQGPIADTVLREAARLDADFLIVGSHGFGAVYDLLVGSVSREILKKANIPVLVVPIRETK